MEFIHDRILGGDQLFAVPAQLGSSLTVETIGNAGFNWIRIACERGAGAYSDLIHQLQVARGFVLPPSVR